MNPAVVFLIVILISLAIFLGIFIPVSVVKYKYRKFVETYSIAVKQLKDINNKYSFHSIKNFDMEHSYDNENMYGDISCQDYLTYELVYYQKQVNKALKDTLENKNLFNQYSKEIKDIIVKLNQKRGNFYLNNDIWQAICRVERGKVTNKMRFAIYDRDHYRCRKCGRRTNDLEVDHIIPIAKGGKSTFDNLQTLCHRCNYKKGSSIENY